MKRDDCLLDGFKIFVLDWALSVLNGFDNNVKTCVGVLTQDIFSNSMYTMAQGIANVITPIALDIIVICFLIEFIKITMQFDVLKWEFALKVFFKLALARAAIDFSFQGLMAIYATVAEWVTKSGSTGSPLGSQVSTALTTILQNMNPLEVLGLMCTMGLCFIAIQLSGIIVIVTAYARTFELLINVSISPLACAFLPMSENGASRITKKYFLNFAGVCLQGLFIIISIKLYGAVCQATIIPAVQSSTGISDISFNMLLGSLVLVMAVVKSSSWAKALFDAA
jgi:hypothetical protein